MEYWYVKQPDGYAISILIHRPYNVQHWYTRSEVGRELRVRRLLPGNTEEMVLVEGSGPSTVHTT